MQNITILSQLFNKNTSEDFVENLNKEYQSLREKRENKTVLTGLDEARSNKPNLF
jgi:hypothetical protein